MKFQNVLDALAKDPELKFTRLAWDYDMYLCLTQINRQYVIRSMYKGGNQFNTVERMSDLAADDWKLYDENG